MSRTNRRLVQLMPLCLFRRFSVLVESADRRTPTTIVCCCGGIMRTRRYESTYDAHHHFGSTGTLYPALVSSLPGRTSRCSGTYATYRATKGVLHLDERRDAALFLPWRVRHENNPHLHMHHHGALFVVAGSVFANACVDAGVVDGSLWMARRVATHSRECCGEFNIRVSCNKRVSAKHL
jgi:hypothetical protein